MAARVRFRPRARPARGPGSGPNERLQELDHRDDDAGVRDDEGRVRDHDPERDLEHVRFEVREPGLDVALGLEPVVAEVGLGREVEVLQLGLGRELVLELGSVASWKFELWRAVVLEWLVAARSRSPLVAS